MDKIIISQDKTRATIYRDNKTFSLYHDQGQVLDLVVQFIQPIGSTNIEITYAKYLNSLDDTAIINIRGLYGQKFRQKLELFNSYLWYSIGIINNKLYSIGVSLWVKLFMLISKQNKK